MNRFVPIIDALNVVLKQDPDWAHISKEMIGKSLHVNVEDYSIDCHLLLTEQGFALQENADSATVSLKGSLLSLMLLGVSTSPQSVISQTGIELAGDVHVLGDFQALFSRWYIDWHTLLAPILGEHTATWLISCVEGACSTLQRRHKSTMADIIETLQEEWKYCPHPEAFKAWVEDVNDVRADVDRLEAKLMMLKKSLAL